MSVAFVTGSTGLLGSNVVRLLLAQGWRVRTLARDLRKLKRQFGDPLPELLEPIEGDLLRPQTYAPHLAGVEAVFHTAAYFRESYEGGRHDAALARVNVDGTVKLLALAADAHVPHFIHTSSIATLRNISGVLLHEDDLADPNDAVDAYYRSKILSDRAVSNFAARHPDLKVLTVIPGWMHGPGDDGPTSAGRFVQDYLCGRLPGVVDASFSLVDARDVAQAMLAALQRGVPGRRYLAAGRAMQMRELMAHMAQVSGIPAPTRSVPRWLLLMLATLQEGWARLSGQPALLSWATVRNIGRDRARQFSDQRLREELGLAFRPVADTLRDAIAWHRDRLQLSPRERP